MTLTKIDKDFKWYWCPLCKCPMTRCSNILCRGTSCNGSGCIHCDSYFERTAQMLNKGLAPKTKEECNGYKC